MKIYTQTFDANRPTLKQINIPNYSNSKIGIEVIKNGEPVELTKDDVKLTSGDTVLSADDVYSGYVTVPVTVGDCGNDTMYKVEIDKETTLIDTDIKLVTPAGTPTGTMVSVEYSLSDMVGQELNADSVEVIQRYNDSIELYNFLNIVDSNGTIVKAWQSPKTQGTPSTEPVWGNNRTTTGRVKSIKIEDGWKLASWCSASSVSIGKTREIKIKQTSTYSNSFKLVINSVKSSVIDAETSNSVEETDPVFTEWKNSLPYSPKVFDITSNGMKVDISTAKCGDIIVDRSGNDNECIGFTFNGVDYSVNQSFTYGVIMTDLRQGTSYFKLMYLDSDRMNIQECAMS